MRSAGLAALLAGLQVRNCGAEWSRSWHTDESALETSEIDCFSEYDCIRCLKHRHCAFCVERDVRTCYNPSEHQLCSNAKFRGWVGTKPLTKWEQCPARSKPDAKHGCVVVNSVTACQQLPCTRGGVGNREYNRQCCLVPLVPWLKYVGGVTRADGDMVAGATMSQFCRADLLFKMLLARSYLSNVTNRQLESTYLHAFGKGLGRLYDKVGYSHRMRLTMFRALAKSVQRGGFDWDTTAIEVDDTFSLKDGAHRVGVALALNVSHVGLVQTGCANVSIEMHVSRGNFALNGPGNFASTVGPQITRQLREEGAALFSIPSGSDKRQPPRLAGSRPQSLGPMKATRRTGLAAAQSVVSRPSARKMAPTYPDPSVQTTRFVAFAWGCAKDVWPDMVDAVHTQAGISLTATRHLRLLRLQAFVRAVYAVDDVRPENLQIKLRAIERCDHEVLAMNLTVSKPQWRRKANGKQLSGRVERLKLAIRTQFKARVPNYIHDIAFHVGDNEDVHTRHLDQVVRDRTLVSDISAPLPSDSSLKALTSRRQKTSHQGPRYSNSSVDNAAWRVHDNRPNVARFLSHLSEPQATISHLIMKMDSQPRGFPLAINMSGDVDILVDSRQFGAAQRATERFFLGHIPEYVRIRVVQDAKGWRFRMEKTKLLYQIHLVEARTAELKAILGRRQQRDGTGGGHLWLPTDPDARRLRALDCQESPSKPRFYCTQI